MGNSELLGKYHIQSELGKGGFATVYRAVDTTLDREVALKVLDPLLLRDDTWAERFRREAKTIAALKHPAIISIYEVNEVEGRLYLAMELAVGGSMAGVIAARGHLPWTETLALLKPVCEALDYAHNQGVIHRDLKPANILLTAEGQPLLTDFGFARLLGDNTMSLSLSGGILGTPAYIAPEVWELDTANAPADIYALGCIVYEMLVGSALFGGKTPMRTMRAHDQGPQYPVTWPEGIPGGLAAVLNKALAREPGARYASAHTFWHALNDLEARAESARQTAQLAAVAAQWRTETEAAIQAGEWSAAKLAVGRWLKVAPGDKDALVMQRQIETAARQAQQQQEAQQEQRRLAAERSRQKQYATTQQQAAPKSTTPMPTESTPSRMPSPGLPPTSFATPAKKKRKTVIWVGIFSLLGLIGICLYIGITVFSGLLRSFPAQTVHVATATATRQASSPTATPRPNFTATAHPRLTSTQKPTAVPELEMATSTPKATATLTPKPTDVSIAGVSLNIINQTDRDIWYIYISPAHNDNWGNDWLGGDIIPAGKSYLLTGVPVGSSDLQAEDENGNIINTLWEIEITGENTWVVAMSRTSMNLPSKAVLRFEDDFTDNRNNWGTTAETDEVHYLKPQNGEYCILIKRTDLTAWEWYEPFRPDQFVAEVACVPDTGTDATCGLGFGPDGDNLYWFEVAPEGQTYALFLLKDDKWQDPLIDWTESRSISPNGWNYLSIERMEGYFSVYVNGTKLKQVKSNIFPTGRIGIGGATYDDGNVTVCLDDLRVWHIE